MHGLITDYPYVALVSTAPETVGFKDYETATNLCRAMSGTNFGIEPSDPRLMDATHAISLT